MRFPDSHPSTSTLRRRDFLKQAALGAAGSAGLALGSTSADAAGSSNPHESGVALFTAPSRSPSAGNWDPATALIWFPDGAPYFETPRNAWVYFRKGVELDASPARASLQIFADARYRLFVNGQYVARGPARSDPRWQYYDVLDLVPCLRLGNNVIAVQVLYYGYGTGQYLPRVPGLAAELHWSAIADGPTRKLGTDGTWKTHLGRAYDPAAPRINGCQGAIEVFDARKDPAGWTALSFDDAGWAAAKTRVLGPWHTPFIRLLPRNIPLLAEEETVAKLAAPVVLPGAGEELFLPARIRRELDQIHSNWHYAPVGAEGVGIPATPADRVSVTTADFGRVEPGYLQLAITAPAGTVIDVAYAEALWEGRAIFDPAAQRPMDRFILAEGRNDLEVAFGWKGFRYAHLLIRNPGGPVRIHRVGIRTRHYPLQVVGAVRTPDAFQKELLQVCARSLEVCMQDGFLDSPSREQQQWMGDARWQAIYNYYLSGDPRLHHKLLAQIAQSQDAEGLTKSRYPDGHENWAPIPAYCLAWVASFLDYYQFTGSLEPARRWWPNLLLGLRWFSRFENEAGLLEAVPHWNYIDLGEFPSGPSLDTMRGGLVTSLNLLYLEGLRAAARIAQGLGDETARRHCERKAQRLAPAIRAQLWDGRREVYPDCWVGGKPSEAVSQPTNALALLHAEKPGTARSAQLHEWFAGQRGKRLIHSSPFLMPVVLRALIRHEWTALAWQIVQERYRPILAAGSATTWEYWDLFHRDAAGRVSVNSGSHAWGAGPLILFFEGFAGVRVLEPGFKRFALAPQLADFEQLSFTLPTPTGAITGSYLRQGARVLAEFTVPPATIAVAAGKAYSPGSHKTEMAA